MMSFSMPLAPCDANTGSNGMTYAKSDVSLPFYHCDLINGMVPLTTALAPKRYSRHCLDIVQTCLDTDMYSHCIDTSRHFLEIWTHLDMSRHLLKLSRYT